MNKPIPEDLVPILAKDEEKQKQIREKSTMDAQSSQARAIGVPSAVPTSVAGKPSAVKPNETQRKLPVPATSVTKMPTGLPQSKSSAAILPATGSSSTSASASAIANGAGKLETSKTVPRISMIIQPIPPFKGNKSKQPSPDQKATMSSTPQQPMSPTTAQRLNANASSFSPNPKAAAFTPVSLDRSAVFNVTCVS